MKNSDTIGNRSRNLPAQAQCLNQLCHCVIVVLLELKLDISLLQLDVKQKATVGQLKIELNVTVGHWEVKLNVTMGCRKLEVTFYITPCN